MRGTHLDGRHARGGMGGSMTAPRQPCACNASRVPHASSSRPRRRVTAAAAARGNHSRGRRVRAAAAAAASSSFGGRPAPADVLTPHSGYHFDGSSRRFFEGWYFKVGVFVGMRSCGVRVAACACAEGAWGRPGLRGAARPHTHGAAHAQCVLSALPRQRNTRTDPGHHTQQWPELCPDLLDRGPSRPKEPCRGAGRAGACCSYGALRLGTSRVLRRGSSRTGTLSQQAESTCPSPRTHMLRTQQLRHCHTHAFAATRTRALPLSR
jgi:hypothetical protein